MGAPHQGDGWEKMTSEFKYIITQAVFSDFAKLGSFIIKGNWMISQSGTINGTTSTAYQNFDENYPDRNNPSNNNFIPYFAVDGLTGRIYAKSGAIGGFAINDLNLVNTNYDAGISISNQYNTKSVQIGAEAQDELTERPVPLVAKMIDTNITAGDRPYNTAMYLVAANATYNYAFHGRGNGVLNGYMQGYLVAGLSGTHDPSSSSSQPQQIKLSNGMVQAVSSVSFNNSEFYLPRIREVLNTLGILGTNAYYQSFCCELIIINQSIVSGSSYRKNIRILGDPSRGYNDSIIDILEPERSNSLPIILREGGGRTLNINPEYSAHFILTYTNGRYIANYIYG